MFQGSEYIKGHEREGVSGGDGGVCVLDYMY